MNELVHVDHRQRKTTLTTEWLLTKQKCLCFIWVIFRMKTAVSNSLILVERWLEWDKSGSQMRFIWEKCWMKYKSMKVRNEVRLKWVDIGFGNAMNVEVKAVLPSSEGLSAEQGFGQNYSQRCEQRFNLHVVVDEGAKYMLSLVNLSRFYSCLV